MIFTFSKCDLFRIEHWKSVPLEIHTFETSLKRGCASPTISCGNWISPRTILRYDWYLFIPGDRKYVNLCVCVCIIVFHPFLHFQLFQFWCRSVWVSSFQQKTFQKTKPTHRLLSHKTFYWWRNIEKKLQDVIRNARIAPTK